ncbi:MAG: hypothetical protein ACRYG8_30230 [Janthinobacterium lividum]
MTVDYTKFPFPSVENPRAATLTEAITAPPVDQGFVLLAIKLRDPAGFETAVRTFAQAVRATAEETGLRDVTAYREFRRNELGGAVPFDQAIAAAMLDNAVERAKFEDGRYPALGPAIKMAKENDIADYTLLLEYASTDQATKAVATWKGGERSYVALTGDAENVTLGAFRNMKRYASVSRDPNVIQFFNFFPGPADADALWQGWQDALPWFFETGEMRSSFPMKALDPEQPLLVVNYAHFDSIKHFFLGVAYDPNYLEVVTRCYADRGFKLPMPFFCKIVPV